MIWILFGIRLGYFQTMEVAPVWFDKSIVARPRICIHLGLKNSLGSDLNIVLPLGRASVNVPARERLKILDFGRRLRIYLRRILHRKAAIYLLISRGAGRDNFSGEGGVLCGEQGQASGGCGGRAV
jgi:hypothetical protein